MGRLIDLTGQWFGRLVVLGRVETTRKLDSPRWRARCQCGTVIIAPGRDLRRGRTRSCGCYRIEVATALLARINQPADLVCQWCHSMQDPEELMPVMFAIEEGGSGMQCRDDRACTKRQKQLAGGRRG